jgi:hypothetical protein
LMPAGERSAAVPVPEEAGTHQRYVPVQRVILLFRVSNRKKIIQTHQLLQDRYRRYHSGLRILQIHFDDFAVAEFTYAQYKVKPFLRQIRSGPLWCNDILISGINISFHIGVMLNRSECSVLQGVLQK